MCRSERDHVHRQGWRTGPPDDAPGWSQISGERVVYEASLGIAFSARRTPARFILISEVASVNQEIGPQLMGNRRWSATSLKINSLGSTAYLARPGLVASSWVNWNV